MIKVYIASPCTKGDQLRNVGVAIEMFAKLLRMGFNPFCPHSHTYASRKRWEMPLFFPQEWFTYMAADLEWLKVCDCVLRLEGESEGADLEVKTAKENDIPVYYTFEQIWARYGGDS